MEKCPRYSEYFSSGVKWLGEIPAHWRVCKLKHIAKVYFSSVDKHTVEGENPVRLCNYVDVYYNDFITPDIGFMEATASSAEMIRFALKKGDVLITKDSESWNDIAVPAYVATELKDVLCGYHLAHIRPNAAIADGKYLFRAFSAHELNDQFRIEATGITRYGLSKYGLDNSLFFLPPVEEQRAIAAFLDMETARIDALIAKKERQIELLQEKRTALISNAVTKGLDPDVKMKDSGIEWLGKIPNHWKISKLGFHASIKARLGWKGLKAEEYVDEGYIFLATPNIKFKDIDFINVNYITKDRYLESPEIMLQKGDVLIAKDGSTLGIINVIRILPAPATVNSSIGVVRPKKEALDSLFLYYLLATDFTQKNIQKFKDGQGVPHLFQADIRKFWIWLPPITEQRSIAAFLDNETTRIDGLMKKIEKSIAMLREYRTALISAAVTGKIDVRDEVQ